MSQKQSSNLYVLLMKRRVVFCLRSGLAGISTPNPFVFGCRWEGREGTRPLLAFGTFFLKWVTIDRFRFFWPIKSCLHSVFSEGQRTVLA